MSEPKKLLQFKDIKFRVGPARSEGKTARMARDMNSLREFAPHIPFSRIRKIGAGMTPEQVEKALEDERLPFGSISYNSERGTVILFNEQGYQETRSPEEMPG